MQEHMKEKLIKQHPLYIQASEYIINKINEGHYLVEEPLPSEWDLATELQVSQGTIRKALTELVHKGILFRRQGVGTFVTASTTDWGALLVFSDSGFDLSKEKPKQEVLRLNKDFATEAIAAYLGLRRGQPIWHLTSLWRYRSDVIALDHAYLPFELIEYLTIRLIKENNGIYPFLQIKQGVHAQIVEDQISLTTLNKDEAQLLQRQLGEIGMLNIRHVQDYNETPIEWRRRILINDHFSIHIRY